jgi:hypothetical protein
MLPIDRELKVLVERHVPGPADVEEMLPIDRELKEDRGGLAEEQGWYLLQRYSR